MLKRFAELGTVHRNEPCQEYPGEWIVYWPKLQPSPARKAGPEKGEYNGVASFEEAFKLAKEQLNACEALSQALKVEYDPRDISISWKCSDNDPRIGQVWFTPYYQHGKFNIFGDYKSS